MSSFSGFWRALKALWQWGDQLAPFLETMPRNLAAAGDARRMPVLRGRVGGRGV